MEHWEKEILDDLFALRNMLYFLILKFQDLQLPSTLSLSCYRSRLLELAVTGNV